MSLRYSERIKKQLKIEVLRSILWYLEEIQSTSASHPPSSILQLAKVRERKEQKFVRFNSNYNYVSQKLKGGKRTQQTIYNSIKQYNFF